MPHGQALAGPQAGRDELRLEGIDVSPKLDVIGDRWVRGWGIGANGAKAPRNRPPQIDVAMLRCTRGGLLAGVKELLGLPVPKLDFRWALVQWVASKLVPEDAIKCQEPARYRVELHVDRRGRMFVAAPMTAFADETHIPDPGRPSTVTSSGSGRRRRASADRRSTRPCRPSLTSTPSRSSPPSV